MTQTYTYTMPGLGVITVDRNGMNYLTIRIINQFAWWHGIFISGNITGNANAGFGLGVLSANTASTSAVRGDVEPQLKKTSHRKKPSAQMPTMIRNDSPLTVPVAPTPPIVPAYDFPPSRAEPPKTINQKKKSSSSKRSSSKKLGSHSRRSHPHPVLPSYFNAINSQTKSAFAPNQIAAEYLDAYFNYLKSYASNQKNTNEQRA